MRKVIVGADPGLSGGIAVLDYETGELLKYFAMPTRVEDPPKKKKTKNGTKQVQSNEIDVTKIWEELSEYSLKKVVIEKVGAMPKQGVTSMFTFGQGYGRLLGVLYVLTDDVEWVTKVTPQKWQAHLFGADRYGGNTKELSAAYVKKHYPRAEIVPYRCRTPHDGITDSICIARYGFETKSDA